MSDPLYIPIRELRAQILDTIQFNHQDFETYNDGERITVSANAPSRDPETPCRFRIAVTDKIYVHQGAVLWTGPHARLATYAFPTLNEVSIQEFDDQNLPPGFPLDDLSAETVYSVVLRYQTDRCDGTHVPDGTFDTRIELLDPDELNTLSGELKHNERAVIVGDVTLKTTGDLLSPKTVNQYLCSDWVHSCTDTSNDDSGSSDVSLSFSSSFTRHSSSGSGSRHDSFSSGSSGSESHGPANCPIDISATWLNRPTCVFRSPLGDRTFDMSVEVDIALGRVGPIAITDDLFHQCFNWWAAISLEGATPIIPTHPDWIVSGNEVQMPIGGGGQFIVQFRFDPFVPCSKHGFSVRVKSGPKNFGDGACCEKERVKLGSFVMPPYCNEAGCTTVVPTTTVPPGP